MTILTEYGIIAVRGAMMRVRRLGKYLVISGMKVNDKDRVQSWGFKFDETRTVWSREWDEDIIQDLIHEPDIELDDSIATLFEGQKDWKEIQSIILDSKRPPYPHQALGNALLLSQKRFLLAWEMGVGKTKPVVDTATHLIEQGEVDLVLVFCPLTVIETWKQAIEEDSELSAVIITGSGDERKSTLIKAFKEGVSFFIFNYDCVRVKDMTHLIEKLASKQSIMILDESHYVKDVHTFRFRELYKLVVTHKFRYIWLLTGTPITQSPEDIYGQAAFINTLYFGKPSHYRSFQARYIVHSPANQHYVVGYRNLDEYMEQFRKFSHRLRKEDAVELPELIFQTVEFDLPVKLAEIYEDYVNTDGVLRRNKESEAILIADNPLTIAMKARQIVHNWSYVTETENEVAVPVMLLDEHNDPKLIWIVEQLEISKSPTIIWYTFKHDKRLIQKTLQNAEISFVTMEKDTKRMEAINTFQNGEAQVFLSTPKAGGQGINLTKARMEIFYNNDYSVRNRIQAISRAHRIGTKHKVTVYDLVFRKTIEKSILRSLEVKKELAKVIMDGTPEDLRAILKGEIWI